ncbi:hypothetical protein LEP1GSC070_2460 [Leptospira santarosai str. AIM]|nr:hypothetical protein LEP1GSC070_2460 [Leptospira santarosai str. AIM]
MFAFKRKNREFESSQVKIEIGLRERKSTENESCSSPKTSFLPKNELPEFEISRML